MDSASILQTLADSYLYGWAGAVIFFVLFVILLKQNSAKGALASKLQKENRDLEQQLSESKEKISELEAKVESLTEETEEKAEEIRRLEERVSSLEREVSEKTEKIKDLEGQVQNYRSENGELKTRVSELEKKTSEQEASIKQKDAEIETLSEKNAKMEKEIEELQFNFNIATLYIHMKKLYDEFSQDYTQNILKGINTMKISDLDMATAQAIFEHAMSSFFTASGEPTPAEQPTGAEEESAPETN